ncbi:SH3 domain-containing protein [Rhodophyticola porphyridii]|uniref:SH3 domain-containing protein n=1 Tax=Rhodophyticola porphyridii TaxID=1852017 RepID=A0A3L9YAP0_9RHOB|nr:hypothetical protein [Rhodophyticola porphyridii]RMA44147.1 hypothetical protein D9R08_04410 [Rhodophyticola porphyridii]
MTRFFLALAAISTLASPVVAEADGPDGWRVSGVSANDVLNARAGPGIGYQVLETLPHEARALVQVVCVPTITREQFFALSEAQQSAWGAGQSRWCLVGWNGRQIGWVNARYLTEDGN